MSDSLRHALWLAFVTLIAIGVLSFFATRDQVILGQPQLFKSPAVAIMPFIDTWTRSTSTPIEPLLTHYVEVINSCGPYFEGTCVNMRSGPSATSSIVKQLRTGVLLQVGNMITNSNGELWYKIVLDEPILYPERVTHDWYIAAKNVQLISNDGEHVLDKGNKATTTKKIIIDLSEQMLYAYDGDTLFMKEAISSGLHDSPTPIGNFSIFKMTPTRYMQGPLPGVSEQFYDMLGVPWDLYFSKDGAVIHGTYWHDHFGEPWSHGCVNLPVEKAKELYFWATIGTPVTVKK